MKSFLSSFLSRLKNNQFKEIQQVAENLKKEISHLSNEKNHLMAIINAVVEGVVITNEKGEIVFINPSFHSLFSLKGNYVGKTMLECLRNKAIHDLVERTIQKEISSEKEIKISVNLEEKYFIVHTVPFINNGRDRGCVTVFYDITRVRALEETRKEFVANVSHELKTPLTNIKGYAETLRGGALNDSSVALQFVRKIEKNALELQSLVEDIIQLSRIESGNFEIAPRVVDLSEVVKSIHDDFFDRLKTKNITFQNFIKAQYLLRVDQKALKQVLSNLVDNAIKYTPQEGIISISAEKENKYCRVSVTDTGSGIPEKDIPRVFERFYQVDKPNAKKLGGSGLGLAIVKHLIQTHGGEVGVKNNPSGGTQFSFTLPIA